MLACGLNDHGQLGLGGGVGHVDTPEVTLTLTLALALTLTLTLILILILILTLTLTRLADRADRAQRHL